MEGATSGSLFHNTTHASNDTTEDDLVALASKYTMYKVGEILNKYYFPIFIPVGIVGNILSFLVMIQPHNRHRSMSLYLSAISVVDTIVLIIGLTSYLNVVHDVHMPPDRHGFCSITNAAIFTVFLCSNFLIISMTFERFYSIIRPHKAASFNTVKKAKITVLCIVLFTILYNLPHLFISSVQGRQCLPYGTAMGKAYGEFYYWASFVISYALPFVLLLTMNSVIIHKLRTRSAKFKAEKYVDEGQGQSQGQPSKLKTSEKQVFAILLLVTFGFLILTTPGYLLFLFIMVVDFTTSPRLFAGYYLFYHVAQKLHYTNHGINFFLYVVSGKKFRTDLMNLFTTKKENASEASNTASSVA